MTWLSLVKALLSVAGALLKWAGDRQLIAAGEARAVARDLAHANERLARAIAARRGVRDDPDSVHRDPDNRDRD